MSDEITETNNPPQTAPEQGTEPLPAATPLPTPASPEILPNASAPVLTPSDNILSATAAPPIDIPELINPQPIITNSTPPVATPDQNIVSRLLNKARAQIQAKKQARLDKIITALAEKPRASKELRALLKKSRYTVVRLMNELEKQNKVRQVGKTGRNIRYELVR